MTAQNLREYRERYYTLMEKKFMFHMHNKMSLNHLESMRRMKFRRAEKDQQVKQKGSGKRGEA